VYLSKKALMSICRTNETFEGVFAKLKNLRVLDLQENLIAELIDFSHLSRLETLNLERNNLTMIKGLESSKSLKRLFISYNCI
jgi:Leucine-rich repeat (LRR) protein